MVGRRGLGQTGHRGGGLSEGGSRGVSFKPAGLKWQSEVGHHSIKTAISYAKG
jgi:hypothetical protein